MSRDKVFKGLKEGNLYYLICKKVNGVDVATFTEFTSNQDKLNIWHRRLGHLNVKSMRELKTMVSGLNLGNISQNIKQLACEGCIQGKK